MEDFSPSSEKTDRRVLRTRAALKEAIIALVLERGYQAVRIHDIAERADVSAATIYLHYDNKEELLVAAMQELYADLIEQARMISQASPTELAPGPRPLAGKVFARIEEHRDLYRVLLSPDVPASLVLRMRGLLTRNFEAAIRARLNRNGLPENQLPLPPAALADYMAAGFMSLLVNWIEGKLPHSAEEMGRISMQLILNGVMGGLRPEVTNPSGPA